MPPLSEVFGSLERLVGDLYPYRHAIAGFVLEGSEESTVSVKFERGDLVFFRHLQHGQETQSGGIVIGLDDGLLTVVLPHGVEVWNMRSALFGSAWRVEDIRRCRIVVQDTHG